MEKYADSIYILHWKEILLAKPISTNIQKIDPQNLEVLCISSYHIQALNKGVVNDIIPVSINGLILTSDNKFTYGLRGGQVEKGNVHTAPAGRVSNKFKGKNPIFSSFYEEMIEELGIGKNKEEYELIGYQRDPEVSKAFEFVIFGQTKYSSLELKELHDGAFNVYQNAKDSDIPELEARKAIEEAGFPNTSAWEHLKLLFVENDKENLQKIIESREIEHDGIRSPLLDIGRGPLIMYSFINNLGIKYD